MIRKLAYISLLGVYLAFSPRFAEAMLGDKSSRAMGLAQSYTALARGPEAVFWNPANLALGGKTSLEWDIAGIGATALIENNSFSVADYNKNFTDAEHLITEANKLSLLSDVPGAGLKINVDADPLLHVLLPINGGLAFNLPGQVRSAFAIGLAVGVEGEVPKDMVELLLFGNDFNRQYDIAKWDGGAWAVSSFNWAIAKALMPTALKPHLSEFTVGATTKFLLGGYGETVRSDGGFISRFDGADLDSYILTQASGGYGLGLDIGVAGVLKNKKTTFSVGLLNCLDTMSWGIETRQDSLFAYASDLKATDFLDGVDDIKDILDNEDIDGDGEVDFYKKSDGKSFSRSLPAMLRVGVSHQLQERLTLAGNWDQVFSEGFGMATTPRFSLGVEYCLVDWLPARFGLSAGGKSNSTSFGFAFGPFDLGNIQLELLDIALVTRGGFLPGVSKGTALGVELFRLNLP